MKKPDWGVPDAYLAPAISEVLPEPFAPPVYLPEAVESGPEPIESHRERDDNYPALMLDDSTRVIDCKDGIQWILQRRRGEQWQGVAYSRRRDALIREAKKLVGTIPEALLTFPDHHDHLTDFGPRCHVCGNLKGKPMQGLPRHLFCLADRKRPQRPQLKLIVSNPPRAKQTFGEIGLTTS